MATLHDRGTRSRIREIVAMAIALYLSFAALADISGGRETDLRLEYLALIGAAAVFAFVGARLVLRGHRWLGSLSIGVLLVCVAAAPPLTAPPAPWARWTLSGGLLWFAAVTCFLVARQRRG
jgi:hypothetical protein